MAKKIKLTDLKPDEKNFNRHNPYGMGLLEKSMRKFGFVEAGVISEDDVIVSGNARQETAVNIGMEDVQIVDIDGTKPVYLRKKGLKSGTQEFHELALALNQVGQKNVVLDCEMIEAELGEAVCQEWGVELPENEVTEDNFDAEPPLKPITVLGDVYELNQHRFSCGSSTEADVVNKTLDGAKPILMVTDPPYGVNYDASWREDRGLNGGGTAKGKVKNDNEASWTEAWSLFSGNVAYVWHGEKQCPSMATQLESVGLVPTNLIVWGKKGLVISRGNYHSQHETCWYAVRKGQKHNWNADRKQSTLWDIDKHKNTETGHSTQKPIECMARPIRNNTFERESVYDPFLGSGTTLIAADQLNRACYGQEIDPAYCDIIVARYIKHKQSSGTEFTIKRNGVLLSPKDIQKYLAQIEKKDEA